MKSGQLCPWLPSNASSSSAKTLCPNVSPVSHTQRRAEETKKAGRKPPPMSLDRSDEVGISFLPIAPGQPQVETEVNGLVELVGNWCLATSTRPVRPRCCSSEQQNRARRAFIMKSPSQSECAGRTLGHNVSDPSADDAYSDRTPSGSERPARPRNLNRKPSWNGGLLDCLLASETAPPSPDPRPQPSQAPGVNGPQTAPLRVL